MSVPESSFTVDDIQNTNAVTDVPVNYLICDRSGFKIRIKAGLMEEWNGVMVRIDSFENRNVQDFVGNRAEVLEGSIRPEPAEDTFVEVNEVQPGDF